MKTARPTPLHTSQRGASLVFALITLVALMLAAIALVRSVDSGTKILGNIGFQQDTIASADFGVTAATRFLTNPSSDLTTNSTATRTSTALERTGYYASAKDPLDATGQQLTGAAVIASRQLIDWDLNNCAYASGGGTCTLIPSDVAVADMGGSASSARYVILRLCQGEGEVSSDSCSRPLTGTSSGGMKRNGPEQDDKDRLGTSSGQYFRIIVRTVGARGTTSFTETIVQY